MKQILMIAMPYDQGRSGISSYIRSVANELAETDHLTLFLLKKDAEIFPLKASEQVKIVTFSNLWAKPLVNMLWHLFILPLLISWKTYDLVFLPAGNRRLLAWFRGNVVVTFHDLSQFHIEAKYDAFRMFYIRKIIPFFLKKYQQIMCVSQATADDLVKFYQVPPEHLIVNHNGFSGAVPEIAESPKEKDCLLYVARIEHPGKNHLNLIKAYELLSEDLKARYKLILPGMFWEGAEPVKTYAEQSADTSRIEFPGFVTQEQLTDYFSRCALFVMPSFYEGFGIPLLDAMIHGVPAVSSTCPALKEVGGEAVLTFDPNSPAEMATVMTEVLENEALQQQMISAGLERVGQFSWPKHADKIRALYAKS